MFNKIKNRSPFSHRLIQSRKAKGLSQYALANKTGISQRMIAHYETLAKNPPTNIVVKLAKSLHISTDELLGHSPTKNKEEVSLSLIKKAKLLEDLSTEDQRSIIKMITALHLQKNKEPLKKS